MCICWSVEGARLCKGFLCSGNQVRFRTGQFTGSRHFTAIKDNLQTNNEVIQVQTQDYDYFGKKTTPVFPKSRHGASVPRSSDSSITNHGTATSIQSPTMNDRGDPEPEYRIMNPMYRIMNEYSTLSNQLRLNRSSSRPISMLVMDEGGEIRSRLAAAMLVFLLGNLRKEISVCVDVASIGPPTLGEANDLSTAILTNMVRVWMKNDTKALEIVRQTPRQFLEVRDPLEYDILLVMDRYDLQATLREVSVLDAISPGSYYSSRVKRIGPFSAHIRPKGPANNLPSQLDIPDPLYFSKDVPVRPDLMKDILVERDHLKRSRKEAENLNALSRDLAYCCKGLVDMLQVIHDDTFGSSFQGKMKPRDILQQVLRCPGLWMEFPYGREGKFVMHGRSKSRKYWPRPSYSGMIVKQNKLTRSRNIKEKGYWKVFENVENELRSFMKENNMSTLPTQAMLRKNGKHSLASSIDDHGGLSIFASKMGLKLYKRRPNGFWSNLKVLKHEITQFIKEEESNHPDSMPTAQELVKAGRSDLVRAIRMHGGFSEVASSIGVKSHRSLHQWEESGILNFLQGLKQNGIEISRTSIRKANLSGLESAIDRLGGFPYFIQLLEDDREECVLFLKDSINPDGNNLSLEKPTCEHLKCPIPYIERVARKLSIWMSLRKSNSFNDRLPTRKELEDAGRLDIWRSIQRAGGVQRMSEYLSLPYKETRGRKSREMEQEKTEGLLEKWNAYEDFILID